jgi:hypothetical protein
MKLVDMKLDPKEQKKEADLAYDPPAYPWGLSISLDDEALEKLGMTELPDVGDTMTLTARVCCTSVSASANENGQRRSVSFQIEALALSDAVESDDEKKDPTDALYTK